MVVGYCFGQNSSKPFSLHFPTFCLVYEPSQIWGCHWLWFDRQLNVFFSYLYPALYWVTCEVRANKGKQMKWRAKGNTTIDMLLSQFASIKCDVVFDHEANFWEISFLFEFARPLGCVTGKKFAWSSMRLLDETWTK